MKILQLSPQFPYPLDHGGAIGIYKLSEAIAKHAQVTLVTYPPEDPRQRDEGLRHLREWCTVKLVDRPLPSRLSTLIRTMFSGAYPIERRMMPEMFELLTQTITTGSFDIVHLDGAQMGKYGLWIKKQFTLPVVLREHNFETLVYERFAANERNPFKKFIAKVHGRRLFKEELSFIRNLDGIIPITKEDETALRSHVPSADYETISGGVDVQYFCPNTTLTDPSTIMWIGGMTWEPNEDAVYYFANEIFPLVLAQYPAARFEVVGAGTETLSNLKEKLGERIILHGKVEDVRPYIERAAVLVCPLRVGGGMRLKLLEFFAMGKAVVSTGIGAEGNTARNNEHIMISDTPAAFTDAVVHILTHPEEQMRLGANARLLAEKEYSWESVGKRFFTFYQRVIERHRGH